MNQSTDLGVVAGKSFPLGATRQADGVNFSVYSKNATTVELLLFDSAEGVRLAFKFTASN